MVCKNCGYANEISARFCTRCGAKLDVPPTEPNVGTPVSNIGSGAAEPQHTAEPPQYIAPPAGYEVEKFQKAGPTLSLIVAIVGLFSCMCLSFSCLLSFAALIAASISLAKGGEAEKSASCGDIPKYDNDIHIARSAHIISWGFNLLAVLLSVAWFVFLAN